MMELILTSSVLILAVLLIRVAAWGKVSRILQYALWILIPLRLLLPVSLASPMSVMNVWDAVTAERFTTGQVLEVQPDSPLASSERAAAPLPAGPMDEPQPMPWWTVIWACGASAVGFWFLWVNFNFWLKLRRSRTAYPVENCPLPVYRVDFLPSPCMFGLFRPAIYLSGEQREDEQKMRHILTHELCHYAQWDPVWSWVRILCVSSYWFHPLVWIAAACSRTDCELACDERAVKRLGDAEKAAYGRTLVEVAVARPTWSAFACTATTMSSGAHRLKQRIMLIAGSPKTWMPALVAVLAVLCLVVGCTFTGRTETGLNEDQAVRQLAASIRLENGRISFTVPKDYPEADKWDILVYGSARMGEGSMSVHLFEQENEAKSWQAGRTYTIDIEDKGYTELYLDVGFRGRETRDSTNLLDLAIHSAASGAESEQAAVYNQVSVTFPAYQEGRLDYNAAIYDTQPFLATFSLPDGWEARLPPVEEREEDASLFTAVYFYKGSDCMGFIGFDAFDASTEVAPENYYQMVYAHLRLGSMYWWDPYTPVQTTDTTETGIAVVNYKNPDEIDKHPGAMADVPLIEVPGILSYDKVLQVYVGIQFVKNAVSDAQVLTIAKSLTISPL